MKNVALLMILGWFMILRTIDGGVKIGPYDSLTTCNKDLVTAQSRLEDAGLVLIEARCVYLQES